MIPRSPPPANNTRPSLGNSTTQTIDGPIEKDDFPMYLKFVNREKECKSCIEEFKELYDKFTRRMDREEQRKQQKQQEQQEQQAGRKDTPSSMSIAPNLPNEDNYNKNYPIVICGGAPGVGHVRV